MGHVRCQGGGEYSGPGPGGSRRTIRKSVAEFLSFTSIPLSALDRLP